MAYIHSARTGFFGLLLPSLSARDGHITVETAIGIQWRPQKFSYRGAVVHGVYRRQSPLGPRREAREGVWETKPKLPEAEAVCRHCLQILTACRNDQNQTSKISHVTS